MTRCKSAPRSCGPASWLPGSRLARRRLLLVPSAHTLADAVAGHSQRWRGLPGLRRPLRVLPALIGRFNRRRGQTQQQHDGHRHQLVGGTSPRQEVGGLGVLLHQRYCPRDPGAA